jgi:hypothetical protein
MEEMKLTMMDDQFLIHIMNNLTADYDLVVDIHNRRIRATENHRTMEELREELDLRYEIRQDWKMGKNKGNGNNNNSTEDTALYAGGKLKESVDIVENTVTRKMRVGSRILPRK